MAEGAAVRRELALIARIVLMADAALAECAADARAVLDGERRAA